MRIHINDDIHEKSLMKLKDMPHTVTWNHLDPDQLMEEIKEVDILIVRSKTLVTKKVLHQGKLGNLKLVIRAGIGMDNIQVEEAKSLGIQVLSTGEASSRSVAELTLTLILGLSRHIREADTSMRQGKFLKGELRGQEIYGKTLGLIGFGQIGKQVAEMAKALGMKVLYTNTKGEIPEYVGIHHYLSKHELLEKSSYISLHLPELPSRELVLDTQDFDLMKEDAYIINTARGSLINEEALLHYLDMGKIQGAALDVFKEEPPKNMKLYTHEKILLTPHMGSQTEEARERVGDAVVSLVDNFIKTGDDFKEIQR